MTHLILEFYSLLRHVLNLAIERLLCLQSKYWNVFIKVEFFEIVVHVFRSKLNFRNENVYTIHCFKTANVYTF